MAGRRSVQAAQQLLPSPTLDPVSAGGPGPAASANIRLIIASDTRLLRESLADALQRRQGISVIGTASESAAALAIALELSPDVMLLDMAMPASLDLVRSIVTAAPSPKIVAFAVGDTDNAALACIEAGASGYVPRHASGEDLAAAVLSVGRGEAICSPRLAASLFRRLAVLSRDLGTSGPQVPLTHREREIGMLIDQGLSNKEIARELSIELATVKNHVHNILDKLQVQRRWQAAAQIRSSMARPRERASSA